MNRNSRRLDKLTDWALERQWTRSICADREVTSDPEWERVMFELAALADAVTEPPPVTFKINPRVVKLYSRKLGIAPNEYRFEVWKQSRVLATPAGRRLYLELQTIEARYA